MKRTALLLFAVAMVFDVAPVQAETSTPANEPPPKLIVGSPAPDFLAQGVVWIEWHAENVNIVPIFGKETLDISP